MIPEGVNMRTAYDFKHFLPKSTFSLPTKLHTIDYFYPIIRKIMRFYPLMFTLFRVLPESEAKAFI